MLILNKSDTREIIVAVDPGFLQFDNSPVKSVAVSWEEPLEDDLDMEAIRCGLGHIDPW